MSDNSSSNPTNHKQPEPDSARAWLTAVDTLRDLHPELASVPLQDIQACLRNACIILSITARSRSLHRSHR